MARNAAKDADHAATNKSKQMKMYCDKLQVNQLTAILSGHGITDVVVCPGSRNATIVHDLHAHLNRFRLHPVTDERSAAFVALGLILALQCPVAVCVTSGSALLGCLPAVAEAYYRHLPLLVISADRPSQWIDQMDGQTLPQNGALHPYCATSQMVEPTTDEERWRNNRVANEALLSLTQSGGGPAHINVEIAEPMFSFTTAELPDERIVRKLSCVQQYFDLDPLVDAIRAARLPVLLVGQNDMGELRSHVTRFIYSEIMLVLPEVISDVEGNWRMNAFDELAASEAPIVPDLVVQIGGNFVHKRFKQLLRESSCKVVRIGHDKLPPDTFCHLDMWIPAEPKDILPELAGRLPFHHPGVIQANRRLASTWRHRAKQFAKECAKSQGSVTTNQAISALQTALSQSLSTYSLHLANSTAVRAAGLFFESGNAPIFCNRGVNGIEGSLSTAVGYAMGMWGLCICIIGDLSFFYDVNALCNVQLPANLRILLLNNGHGAIFDHLPGLSASSALADYVAAGGRTYSARGIAETFGLGYHSVSENSSLRDTLHRWIEEADAAQILEVFTNN